MRHLVIVGLCAVLSTSLAISAKAQSSENDMSEGMDLMSQGTKLLLRGLMGEMEPALRELEGMLNDLNSYHPPEILPNGDIIIRRKIPNEVSPKGNEIDL